LFCGSLLLVGCALNPKVEPPDVCDPRFRGLSIAVAPALNLSGSDDFDPVRFAEAMAVELDLTEGLAVIAVNRVLAALAKEGLDSVQSADHAQALGRAVGSDAVLVFSVTQYDPYDPPSIAITAQLYGAGYGASGRSVTAASFRDEPGDAGSDGESAEFRILAQTQRVFDASHQSIIADIKGYARRQGTASSPYGWREFVVNQRRFIKYCCHGTVRALFGGPSESGVAEARDEVRRP